MVLASAREEIAESIVDANDLGVGVLFHRLLDAIVIARLPAGRIVLWNAAAEKLFGYAADEVIGESIEILMPEPIAQVHRIGLDRYVRTGHGLIVDAGAPVEMPAQTKSGESIRIELALSELSNPRGQRFALAVIRDATHRKQLELTNLELVQARLARSEAEAELAARDELLDSVTATLQSSPHPDDITRLAATLVDFRRLHGGEVAIRPIDADLVDLVHVAADAVRRRSAGRRLLVYTPPSAPATFDASRTRQVLEQVIDEALHHCDDGARVEVCMELPSPHTVQVTVHTDGPGLGRNVGVALHLSRTLMQRQGGTFTCATTSNGGLEVVLTFPGVARHTPRRRRATATGRQRPTSS
jgi:PAS domain S-box-containing protein